MKTTFTFTFWYADFVGENFEQLVGILRQQAVEGTGKWFDRHATYIRACMYEDEYTWIMENVANYGNPEINK